ncbi:glycosyltransferase [Nonlabens agnitus]|uniref:Glycosyltransferase 2-like domain-containing protein n=1 Tax=Nonlabens agnitus TaxID=870484 RepID=A0A2S9WUJ6_9FLAO|nr:glycosyltransferase [Nonlabens agnitus]PRP67006.1 hypothetical protein BST86_07785 [Nonlabens agnitus]
MIAVIVPCYNEEKRLKVSAFKEFIKANGKYHFFFVDDGSTDETYQMLYDNFYEDSRSNIIKADFNLGKGEAIRFAISKIPHQSFHYLAFIDADLEIPLDQLIELEKAFYSIPDTIAGLSIRIEIGNKKSSLVRRVGSSMIRKISSKLIGFSVPIRDTQCGCKMFSVRILDVFKEPFISSWLFDIEIILRIRNKYDKEGQSIRQIPLRKLNSVDGKINYKAAAILKLTQQLNKIRRCYN